MAYHGLLDEVSKRDLLRCETLPTLDLTSVGVGVVYGMAVTLIAILGFVSIMGD